MPVLSVVWNKAAWRSDGGKAMTKRDSLTQIMGQYRHLGVVKGGELLLRPDDALRLAEELGRIGIAIMGCDGWYYVKPDDDRWIAQDLAVDYYVGDDILQCDEPVRRSVEAVKQFIKTEVTERTAFISFTLDVPASWDLFPEEAT
jgi:hypothetical protein